MEFFLFFTCTEEGKRVRDNSVLNQIDDLVVNQSLDVMDGWEIGSDDATEENRPNQYSHLLYFILDVLYYSFILFFNQNY